MNMADVMFVTVLLLFSAIYFVQGFDLPPPRFREKPKWPDRSYYDEDGPPIELECKVTNTSHTLSWYKDGQLVDVVKDQLLLVDQNQTLVFEDPKQFQSGIYKCLAYNRAGNVSHSGNILITARKQETRPRIVQTQPVNTVKHAEVGDTVNISCTFDVGGSVEALMDLAVEWFKGPESVNDTNHTTYGLNNTFQNNKVSSLNIDKLQTSDYGTYKCYGENSKGNASKLISVIPPERKQKHLPLTLIIGCSAAGFVAMATVVVVIVVRHRYKMKQKYEDLEWLDPDFSQYEVPDRKVEYDVFISYSSEDLNWAKDVLFYKLSDQGYEVCIDFKDFTPGMAIAENIMDAIYRSHKTIVLMSKNFLKSMWGQFELQQAHNRAIMQRSDALILIKHDTCKVPGKLMGKTFLDWSDDKVQPHFWTRLFEAIGEPGKFTHTGDGNQDTDDISRKLSETTGEQERFNDTSGESREPEDKNRKMCDENSEDEHIAHTKIKNMKNEETENAQNLEKDKTQSGEQENENVDNFQDFKAVNLRADETGVLDEVFGDGVKNYEEFNSDTVKIIDNCF
ncbi:interleukin-18 receptor accessory protein-like isoform X2 [Mercenaria mercenaria]|nr:interleukin-18 receptor accessory protein-like isoform X2 [Mercenaria mercenaria]